jgi:hypothetical protein
MAAKLNRRLLMPSSIQFIEMGKFIAMASAS